MFSYIQMPVENSHDALLCPRGGSSLTNNTSGFFGNGWGKRIQGDSYDIVIFPLLGVDDNCSTYFHALAVGVSALGLAKRLLSRALDVRLKAIFLKLLSTQERLAGYHGKYD